MAWFENDNNWNDYDPTYLIHLSEQIEETKWMVDFFKRCTRAIIESDYYTLFAIPDAYKIRTGRMEDYDFTGYAQFTENNPEYEFELHCPKDGNIVVDFNWNRDGTLPVEIYGIEYLGRLMGENEEIPSNTEKTLSDLAEEDLKELDYDLRVLGCLEKNSLSAKNDLFTRGLLVCVYAFITYPCGCLAAAHFSSLDQDFRITSPAASPASIGS